jgi:predicted membrane-bound mannosyltransferase/DNA-binding beta-propeller fold protein YncE
MENTQPGDYTWLNRSISNYIKLNPETLIFAIIIILAFITRLYGLGDRVMSHDENSHVYFSWLLEQGKGYKHDPITHGPLQFHLIALSYFIFGDNDLTARLPAALFSIATVAFMWNYRKLIGRAGSLAAALMLLISPFLMYYGRYARNEAFIGLFGVLMVWAILRYFQSGETKYLLWVTIANALHFTSKETSFIYAAQAMLFLALVLIYQVSHNSWQIKEFRKSFLLAFFIGTTLTLIGAGLMIGKPSFLSPSGSTTATTVVPGQELSSTGPSLLTSVPAIFIGIGVLMLLISMVLLVRGYGWQKLKENRSLDLLIIIGTAVLPMMAPFPVKLLGKNAIDYTVTTNIIYDVVFISLFAIIAIAIGLLWKPRLWLVNTGIFYAIFTVFYTTFFSWGTGFLTGLVGSLGYWLEQQGVNRGSQPWYYYGLIQIPIYEYLPALLAILAIISGLKFLLGSSKNNEEVANNSDDAEINTSHEQGNFQKIIFALLSFWSVTSLIAYTIAGEKMPWLTFHIAWPMILLAGWYVGNIIDHIDWSKLKQRYGLWVMVLIPIFVSAFISLIGSALGSTPPFQGKELVQIQATNTFLAALAGVILCGWILYRLMKNIPRAQTWNLTQLTIFVLGCLLIIHTSLTASFINYDDPTEYLVYAHSATGVKIALSQIEEISRRTTGGLDVNIAYDNATTYPYWWYLRNYPNLTFYGENPTRELRNSPLILVGDANYGKIEPVVGQAYYAFDYMRIWWPNQDYFGLTWERIVDAALNPQMRDAIFRIWLYRDYSLYGQLTNEDISLQNWNPAERMRLYIRKDIVSKLWNYGTTVTQEAVVADPYEGKQIELSADNIIGSNGSLPGQFQHPHGLAISADGSLYIADTDNNRVQHISPQGEVIKTWGTYGDITSGSAPEGTFNQPWGIAIGPDGSVYVTDTWNHRIQKFNAAGEFIKMWGYFGQAENPDAMWGPRDVVVDTNGHVIISDTGNKRILIFDQEGNFLSEFGGVGLGPGQFDEPVGLAVSNDGKLYVADTWNQRVQVFIPGTNNDFIPLTSWDIAGWYGQSLDNKPYLAVDSQGDVFVTDPEGYRILQFNSQGDFIQYWGTYSQGPDGFDLPASVAVDLDHGVWVSDAGNNRVMHFTLPLNTGN